MKNDNNGQSICPAGKESFEKFKAINKKFYIQYDYRDTDGVLFSCIAPTLEDCREKRDKWLIKKEVKLI